MYKEDKVKAYVTSKELLFDIEDISKLKDLKVSFGHRLESRTRDEDLTNALRFRVHDPLWMLARQWQLGELKGNNAGSALAVECYIKRRMAKVSEGKQQCDPIEPEVESVNHDATPLMRVEAAMYFIDLLQTYCKGFNHAGALKALRTIFPLDDMAKDFGNSSLEAVEVQEHTRSLNTRLGVFSKAFATKLFDGVKLYDSLLGNDERRLYETVKRTYEAIKPHCENCGKYDENQFYWEPLSYFKDWMQKTYFPKDKETSHWKNNQLGYDCKVEVGQKVFEAKDYSSGQLSWYSFDICSESSSNDSGQTERPTAIPTLATYPGAPSKRLWQFEDHKVFLGNAVGMQAKGNIAMMQYATMYGNDWMLIPLTTELGTYFSVDKIIVTDSFGITSLINKMSGTDDDNNVSFGQRWQMFGNVYNGQRKRADSGLFFPPALNQIMEGTPLEEVQLLRDETSNMVWGVETSTYDGCGGNIDLGMEATQVQTFIDEQNHPKLENETPTLEIRKEEDGSIHTASNRTADYAYVLQTQVPLNWIPFVPQHPSDSQKQCEPFFLGGRDVVLRRGKMPCFFNNEYKAVRPRTQFLSQGIRKENEADGVKESPLIINEEEVQQVGTRIVKNFQRARWINGKTFNWLGYQTQIKGMQGNSGLLFDSLIDANVKKKDK